MIKINGTWDWNFDEIVNIRQLEPTYKRNDNGENMLFYISTKCSNEFLCNVYILQIFSRLSTKKLSTKLSNNCLVCCESQITQAYFIKNTPICVDCYHVNSAKIMRKNGFVIMNCDKKSQIFIQVANLEKTGYKIICNNVRDCSTEIIYDRLVLMSELCELCRLCGRTGCGMQKCCAAVSKFVKEIATSNMLTIARGMLKLHIPCDIIAIIWNFYGEINGGHFSDIKL